MKNYRLVNNIMGWVSFLVALFVYLSTAEPTASFWDCGEFIASSFKLQVGHPPGAPLFLMLAKIFSLPASDNAHVAIWMNGLSATVSALTILFLFWSITHLARKILVRDGSFTTERTILIMGSGLVGAMAYTFSDSFWFSAVEAEVYAMSSFFTAIVFWLILKWENVADEKKGNRWIILIAYLMGLSIGVHLLNLLAVPALAFVYYFRKYKPTRLGLFVTFILSIVILGAIQYGIIPGIVSMAAKFDLLFVNSFNLPFGSGIIFYAILIVGGISWGLYYTSKKGKVLWNTVILCFAFILVGYSSFTQILVRSAANTPLDENNPENVFNLLSYLNREQYGDRPLGYGQYYNAKVVDQKEGEAQYYKGKDKYIIAGHKTDYEYDASSMTIFPRMYSNQSSHVSAYKEWSGIKGDQKPTFSNNMKYFFTYQMGFMYGRYFLWNFVGRQNDIQGHGSNVEGNWYSGVPAIDAWHVGPQDKVSKSMTNNKGMNKFYFLPLILGCIGLFYQLQKAKKDTFIVFLLFFFTGIAIVIYLNQTPYQPRERDYAYSGSFYAFAFWIGLGVLGIAEMLKKILSAPLSAVAATMVGLLMAPVLMAKDGWDDHDRSKRYTARDFAYDYLNSCEKNAILFTNGDNDTFPLWYAQEVEGIRTDVRVINLSLLNTDWYIDQLKKKAYDSDPVPFSISSDKYVMGTRDYLPVYDRGLKESVDLATLVKFMTSEDEETKLPSQGGEPKLNYVPIKKVKLDIDTAEIFKNGVLPRSRASEIVPSIEWELNKNYIMKGDMMMLDLIANNNWKRPIYFAITVGSEGYLNLEDYFQLEGLAYKLVPVKTKLADGQTGKVESAIMYKNLMEKFKWGGMDQKGVYLDENNLRMTMNFRNNFGRLAETYLAEGNSEKAIKVLDKSLQVMPAENVPLNIFVLRYAQIYYRAGANDKGDQLVKKLADVYEDDLSYYFSLKGKWANAVERDMQQAIAVLQELGRITKEAGRKELSTEMEKRFTSMLAKSGLS